MLKINKKLQNWFFRFASRYFSPKLFLSHVPSEEEMTSFTGRLSLETVSHCWNYSHLMAYNLSSYVNYPPKELDVTVTIFYTEEDQATVDMLEYFGKQEVENVTWNWQEISKAELFRRAIGRNKAALNTKANWVWYIDCDLMFNEGCFDTLAKRLQGKKEALFYPRSEMVTDLLDSSHELVAKGKAPDIRTIDSSMFYQIPIRRAVGAYQITHGDVARACGYCNNIKLYQTPEAHWEKTYEDRTYRWLIKTQGVAIEIPSIYRIRHQEKGRYRKGTFFSAIRRNIRLLKTSLLKTK